MLGVILLLSLSTVVPSGILCSAENNALDEKFRVAVLSILREDWKYLAVSESDINEFWSTCSIFPVDLDFDGKPEAIMESRALMGNSGTKVFYLYKDGPKLERLGVIPGASLSIESRIDDIKKRNYAMILSESIVDHSVMVVSHYNMIDGHYIKDPRYTDVVSEPAK